MGDVVFEGVEEDDDDWKCMDSSIQRQNASLKWKLMWFNKKKKKKKCGCWVGARKGVDVGLEEEELEGEAEGLYNSVPAHSRVQVIQIAMGHTSDNDMPQAG